MCIRDSIRLPDNLFTDAGTEVGSDLIVLQKNTRKLELTHSVDDAFKYATKVLVEHAITNLREINCSVLGDENDA